MPSNVTRRAFLLGVTGSALAAAAGCRPAGLIPPTQYQPGSTPLPTLTPAPTVILSANAKADPHYGEIVFDKIFTTPVDSFYVTQYDYSRTPTLDKATWSMKIDGLVDTPMTFVYDDIAKYEPYEEMRTIQCIGNPVGGSLIGNAIWKGFHAEALFDKLGIQTKATHVKITGADGYTTGVQMKYVRQPNVMFATEMNGAPLNTTHGFPIRIMMPGLYGQKMPRWITHIEFIDQDYIGFWEGNGYSNLATVNTNSIIKSPPNDSRADAAEVGAKVQIQGVAYAAPRLITKVEVRINDGEWMPAKITLGPNNLTWAQWRFEWVPTAPGAYTVAVRVTDESGFVQDKENTGIFGDNSRDGTSAIHQINVRAETPKA